MMKTFATFVLLAALTAPLAAKPASIRAPEDSSAQFNCDTLQISQRLDPATLHDLEPAHSLDAAAAVLTKHGVKFEHSQGIMTLSSAPPRLLRTINTMPQGEPIILPNGDGSAICVLRPSVDSY
jgi:hypothetical protein